MGMERDLRRRAREERAWQRSEMKDRTANDNSRKGNKPNTPQVVKLGYSGALPCMEEMAGNVATHGFSKDKKTPAGNCQPEKGK